METLIYFCQLALQKESKTPLSSRNISNINWEELLRLAARHKVRPLLYKGINKWAHKLSVPEEVMAKLKAWSFYFTTKNLNNTKGLTQLVQLLRQQKIEVIPLKGVVLANLAYGDLGARESSDIDLLIQTKDYPTLKEILHAHSYVSQEMPEQIEQIYIKYNCEQKFELFQGEQQIYNVDVHWLIGSKMQQLDKNFNDIIPFSSLASLFGTKVNLLNPEGLILTTCLHHGGKERWQFLKNNCDLAAILQRYEQNIDWKKLLQQASQLQVANLLLLGLGATSKLFKINLPDPIINAIRAANLQQQIEQTILELNENINTTVSAQTFLEGMTYHLSLRASWRTKAKILYYHIVQFIVPNTNDLTNQHLSYWEYWELYLKKPFRLWNKYIKQSRVHA